MESPIREMERKKTLLEQARRWTAQRCWGDAEAALREAVALDPHHPDSYDLMAELLEARGDAERALDWRDKARFVRKQAWQRAVEAEARGTHEVLGTPRRHEIP